MKLSKSVCNRLFVTPGTEPFGVSVAIIWRRAWQEWEVIPSWNLDADYHTTDATDAIDTAHAMIHSKQAADHKETAPADCLCAVCLPH